MSVPVFSQMETKIYEVLPLGNLDFDDMGELKDMLFDKETVESGYDSKANVFLVRATLKNDRTQRIEFQINASGFMGNPCLIRRMQFSRIESEVRKRAS